MKLEEAFEFLDKFLAGSDYVAGSTLTIADISLVASVTTIQVSKEPEGRGNERTIIFDRCVNNSVLQFFELFYPFNIVVFLKKVVKN